MGGAVMIGLGIALAQPKLPVVVITGDGEMLMGMGSLATVGLQKPGNLTIVVLDNESLWRDRRAGEPYCGCRRPRRRRQGVRHHRIARAMTTMAEVEAFAPALQDVTSGPRFASVKIDGANLERVLSSRGRHLHRQPHPRRAADSSRS